MNAGINAIYSELKRLKNNGESRIFTTDETTESLNTLIKGAQRSRRTNDVSTPKGTNPLQKASTPSPKPKICPDPPLLKLPSLKKHEQMSWLSEQIAACDPCSQFSDEGLKPVLGVGSHDSKIFFCTDFPDLAEAKIGRNLVGEAGALFQKILTAMGLTANDVYITSILKWHPFDLDKRTSRPPVAEEFEYCLPYLKAELKIIKPEVIITLGSGTLPPLLGPDPKHKLPKVRGKWSEWENTPLLATFHPTYLLNNGTLRTRRIFWEDMLKVMDCVDLPVSSQQQRYFLPKE